MKRVCMLSSESVRSRVKVCVHICLYLWYECVYVCVGVGVWDPFAVAEDVGDDVAQDRRGAHIRHWRGLVDGAGLVHTCAQNTHAHIRTHTGLIDELVMAYITV